MTIPYTAIFCVICIGVFWYRAFEMDGRNGVVGAGLGVGVWLLTPGGFLLHVGGQVCLFFAITAWRVLRDRRRG